MLSARADYRDRPWTRLFVSTKRCRLVLAEINPLPAETVTLADARGRVLCEAVRAAVDLPPFDSSAMDGFAVRASDTPGRLPSPAHLPRGALSPGSSRPGRPSRSRPARWCRTGPTRSSRSSARGSRERRSTSRRSREGEHVRLRGGDVRRTEVVAPAGARLGSWMVGAAAAVGAATRSCRAATARPILATGSELRLPGETLRAGEIYEANTELLAALLEPDGCGDRGARLGRRRRAIDSRARSSAGFGPTCS